jgi:hypothetical protein
MRNILTSAILETLRKDEQFCKAEGSLRELRDRGLSREVLQQGVLLAIDQLLPPATGPCESDDPRHDDLVQDAIRDRRGGYLGDYSS